MIFGLAMAAASVYVVARVFKKPQTLRQILAQEPRRVLSADVLSSRQTPMAVTRRRAFAFPLSLGSRHPISRLLKMSNTKPRYLVLGVVASVASALFYLFPALLLVLVIRTITLGRSLTLMRLFGLVALRSQLLFLGVALLFAHGVNLLMEYFQQKTWRELSRSLEHKMRVQTVAYVQQLDLAYLENQSSGRLMHVIYDDAGQVNRFFETEVDEWVRAIVNVLALGAIFLFLSPLLMLLVLISQPLLIWFGRYMQKQVAPRYRDVGHQTDEFKLLLTSNLGGLPTVKSFIAEDFEVLRMAKASEAVRQNNVSAVDTSSAYSSLMRFMLSGNLTAVIIFAAILASTGALSLGAFLLVAGVTSIFFTQMRGIDGNYDLYKRATASAERILHLLETPIFIRSGQRSLPRARAARARAARPPGRGPSGMMPAGPSQPPEEEST